MSGGRRMGCSSWKLSASCGLWVGSVGGVLLEMC